MTLLRRAIPFTTIIVAGLLFDLATACYVAATGFVAYAFGLADA